jgi:hypothetical protein
MVAPSVPTLRTVEISVPSSPVPQVPSLTPVPDIVLPASGPSAPSVAPVPSLEPVAGIPASVPNVQDVPQVVPTPDRCAIEGTDAACSR